MLVSAILVHYRTPELLAPSIAALQRSAARANLDLEVLVVDNSGELEADAVASLGAVLLAAGSNLGFAGGVNLGVGRARADVLVPMNPDVEVGETCLAELVAALDSGFAVAGPTFSWDPRGLLRIPPTEVRSRSAEVRRRLATSSPQRLAAARHAWRRHAWRHWDATAPLPSWDLSGALLAVRRSTWLQVGGFDEGYRLYFEETDWLRRLRRSGLRGAYVPSARARHAFARSTNREPAAAAWFAASAERFARLAWGARFLERLAMLPVAEAAAVVEAKVPTPALVLAGQGLRWVEVSPSPLGFPAAGARTSAPAGSPWVLPSGLDGSMPSGTVLFAREVASDGVELATAVLEVS